MFDDLTGPIATLTGAQELHHERCLGGSLNGTPPELRSRIDDLVPCAECVALTRLVLEAARARLLARDELERENRDRMGTVPNTVTHEEVKRDRAAFLARLAARVGLDGWHPHAAPTEPVDPSNLEDWRTIEPVPDPRTPAVYYCPDVDVDGLPCVLPPHGDDVDHQGDQLELARRRRASR